MRTILFGGLLASLTFNPLVTTSVYEKEVVKNSSTTISQPLTDDIIGDIIQSIPSPLEISSLAKQLGATYDVAQLNDHNAVSKYTTSTKQALNLGVYSTDLNYANLYNKNQDALNYLNSVRKLADALSIGQFFDYNTLKKFAQSSENLDSLLINTTKNFEKINNHLRQQKREHLSILMVTGGWVEAMHLTSITYAKNTKNAKLREKIAEQSLTIDRILLILDIYKSKPGFAEIIVDLQKIQEIFNRVQVVTIKEAQGSVVESNIKIVNGIPTIENEGGETTYEISEKDALALGVEFKKLRDKIIK